MSEELSYKIKIDQSDLEMQLQAIQSAASTALNALFTPINAITDKLTNAITSLATIGTSPVPFAPTSYNAAIMQATQGIRSPAIPNYATYGGAYETTGNIHYPGITRYALEKIFPSAAHAVENVINFGAQALTLGHWKPFKDPFADSPVWLPPTTTRKIYQENLAIRDLEWNPSWSGVGKYTMKGILDLAGMYASFQNPLFAPFTMTGFGMELGGMLFNALGLTTIGKGLSTIGHGLTEFGQIPYYIGHSVGQFIGPTKNIGEYGELASAIKQLSYYVSNDKLAPEERSALGRGMKPLAALGRAMDLENVIRDVWKELGGHEHDVKRWMDRLPTLVATGYINPFSSSEKVKEEFKKLITERIAKTMMALKVGEDEALQALIRWKQMGVSGDATIDSILTGSLATAKITGLDQQKLMNVAMPLARSLLGTGMDLQLAPQALFTSAALTYGGFTHGLDARNLMHMGGPAGLQKQLQNLMINLRRSPLGMQMVAGLLNPQTGQLDTELLRKMRMGELSPSEIITRGVSYLSDESARTKFILHAGEYASKLSNMDMLYALRNIAETQLKTLGKAITPENEAFVISAITHMKPQDAYVIAQVLESGGLEQTELAMERGHEELKRDTLMINARRFYERRKRRGITGAIKDWVYDMYHERDVNFEWMSDTRKRIEQLLKKTITISARDNDFLDSVSYDNLSNVNKSVLQKKANEIYKLRNEAEAASEILSQYLKGYPVYLTPLTKANIEKSKKDENIRKKISLTFGMKQGFMISQVEEYVKSIMEDTKLDKNRKAKLQELYKKYEQAIISGAGHATIHNITKEMMDYSHKLENFYNVRITTEGMSKDDYIRNTQQKLNAIENMQRVLLKNQSDLHYFHTVNMIKERGAVDQLMHKAGVDTVQILHKLGVDMSPEDFFANRDKMHEVLEKIGSWKSYEDAKKFNITRKEYSIITGDFENIIKGYDHEFAQKAKEEILKRQKNIAYLVNQLGLSKEDKEILDKIYSGLDDTQKEAILKLKDFGRDSFKKVVDMEVYFDGKERKLGDVLRQHGLFRSGVLAYFQGNAILEQQKSTYTDSLKYTQLMASLKHYLPELAGALDKGGNLVFDFKYIDQDLLKTMLKKRDTLHQIVANTILKSKQVYNVIQSQYSGKTLSDDELDSILSELPRGVRYEVVKHIESGKPVKATDLMSLIQGATSKIVYKDTLTKQPTVTEEILGKIDSVFTDSSEGRALKVKVVPGTSNSKAHTKPHVDNTSTDSYWRSSYVK